MLHQKKKFGLLSAISLTILVFAACQESERERQLANLLNSTNYSEQFGGGAIRPVGPGLSGGSSGSEAPAEKPIGYCGDNKVNAPDEHCDGSDVSHTRCDELAPGSIGAITCGKNCHFDISQCITPMTNTALGGVAETCKCNCEQESCSGGCVPGQGETRCVYQCQVTCPCLCGPRTNVTIEECDFRCVCALDDNNNIRCGCSLEQCDLVNSTKPNLISTISPAGLLAP